MSDRVDAGISWPAARPDICDIRLFRSCAHTVPVMDADLFPGYGGRAARVHAGADRDDVRHLLDGRTRTRWA
jgi:hypothetical protein